MDNRNTPPRANPPARETRPPREDPSAGVDEDIENLAQAGAEDNEGLDQPGDVGFDRVVGPEEVGLGDGLDQAEEAQLGVTDEELEELTEHLREPRQWGLVYRVDASAARPFEVLSMIRGRSPHVPQGQHRISFRQPSPT